jgi:hypothetical protein
VTDAKAVPLPEPGACRWCRTEKYDHCQRWMPEVGWHQWTAPTDEQRKERMLARRAVREAARKARRIHEAWQSLIMPEAFSVILGEGRHVTYTPERRGDDIWWTVSWTWPADS